MSEQPRDEMFNLENTEDGRVAVFFGESESDAIDNASEFWGTDPANIEEREI